MAKVAPQLEELLAPVVHSHGLELESVSVFQSDHNTIVRVTVDEGEQAGCGVDSDNITEGAHALGGIDSEVLADVSRAISATLDQADPISEAYMLEVSTPGAERELTKPRHWRKEVGHLISVKLNDGTSLVGRLLQAEESVAILDNDGQATTIDYAQIKKARPRVEFGSDHKE